jgi:hypothetical protein
MAKRRFFRRVVTFSNDPVGLRALLDCGHTVMAGVRGEKAERLHCHFCYINRVRSAAPREPK